MTRPKFFRDPIHVQIRFENVDLTSGPPGITAPARRHSWLLRRLIDSPEFQRLRFIRQTGLANLVFHGSEHSRFAHCMGVAYLAGEMYDRIVRNMGERIDHDVRLDTTVAALLHDVGHGPFSHTMEEILQSIEVPFDHEQMTLRLIFESSSVLNKILREAGSELPDRVSQFVDKTHRNGDHWKYRLVSSQLDADRLDYLQRDAQTAGIRGHGFDLARLLDLLHHVNGTCIAVERGGMEAVEAYLMTMDQMYRSVYYHHANRAANFVLTSVLGRASRLYTDGNTEIFGSGRSDVFKPVRELVEKGQDIDLPLYARLGEHHIWSLIDSWRNSDDRILSDLSNRIFHRKLFKTIEIDPGDYRKMDALRSAAFDLVKSNFFDVDDDTVSLYVGIDEPRRTSYKLYDWWAEGPDESIWMIGEDKPARPIEHDREATGIVSALKETRHFHRLIFPAEIRDQLRQVAEKA